MTELFALVIACGLIALAYGILASRSIVTADAGNEKMQEIGLMENKEPGYAEYDNYMSNGMMLQLRRILPGDDIEEDHMRNRQLVASWAFERGREENVVERKVIDDKTYFVVNDYEKLRGYFGELLREIQRIKSEGDFEAGRNLVETYGVKVDQQLHAEVLRRSEPLNLAPYSGFVNPIASGFPVQTGQTQTSANPVTTAMGGALIGSKFGVPGALVGGGLGFLGGLL